MINAIRRALAPPPDYRPRKDRAFPPFGRAVTTATWVQAGLAMLVGLFVFVLALSFTINTRHDQQQASARSILANCQQIEQMKGQIRGGLTDALSLIPGRPSPAAVVVYNTIHRFQAIDCYQLPTVRRYGLKRPS